MPEFNFDFPDDREFELIDVGNYNCVVEQIEERKSSAGYPYLNWRFKIVDGKYKGRVLFYMTSLQDQSMWKLKAVCKALGVPVQPGVNRVNTDNLMSRPCICVVGHREFNDTMQEDVTEILPGTVTGVAAEMVPNIGGPKPTTPTVPNADEMITAGPVTTNPAPVETPKPTVKPKGEVPF